MRIVVWGTYDTGKPRVRILLKGLRANGVEMLECHSNIWRDIEDKSRVSGLVAKFGLLCKWLLSYPALILKYLRLPRHDAVFVGYMGHLDVLVLWPFARLRGVPIVWDAFLSLYNTVVEDRKLVGARHPWALFLYGWEWLACRAADVVLLDTRAHADYFVEWFNIAREKTEAVFVGAETDLFPPPPSPTASKETREKFTVLFYGQFIPLHGIETIIKAARQLKNAPVQWVLIGQGQEETKMRDMLRQHPLPKIDWIPWVPYEELTKWIQQADVCLGIFGDTTKAAMVIPNKVFQIISSGKPLITRDSAAVRELLDSDMPGVCLLEQPGPATLAQAIIGFMACQDSLPDAPLHRSIAQCIEPATLGNQLLGILRKL